MSGLARDVAADVAARRRSAVEIAAESLDRIERANPDLNAFLEVSRDAALAEAKEVDRRVAAGERLPLAGVPLAVKDNMWVAGRGVSCASRILEGFMPPGDATAVGRLREAGAVFVGKTNLDEFAMGSSTENSAFQATRNPWDRSRIPGGSSGGSAAAVAARLVPGALGSDTGGSIRQPGACSGVVGFKPSYGRVSRWGLVAFGSSLDQIGPLTRDVSDAARIYAVMAGADPLDSTCAARPVGDPEGALERGVDGMRIGLLAEGEVEGLDPRVAQNFDACRRAFERAGAHVRVVSVPRATAAIAIYYVVASAEASSNLARYDGVRYGARRSDASVSSLYVETPAFRLGEKMDDSLQMYLSDIFTVPASLAGLPAISIPSGRTPERLPLGLQIMAPRFGEETLFAAARAVEREIDFPSDPPPAARPYAT